MLISCWETYCNVYCWLKCRKMLQLLTTTTYCNVYCWLKCQVSVLPAYIVLHRSQWAIVFIETIRVLTLTPTYSGILLASSDEIWFIICIILNLQTISQDSNMLQYLRIPIRYDCDMFCQNTHIFTEYQSNSNVWDHTNAVNAIQNLFDWWENSTTIPMTYSYIGLREVVANEGRRYMLTFLSHRNKLVTYTSVYSCSNEMWLLTT